MRFPLSRMISNTNLFSPRFTMSRAMTSSSIFTLWTVTRSGGCFVSKFYFFRLYCHWAQHWFNDYRPLLETWYVLR